MKKVKNLIAIMNIILKSLICVNGVKNVKLNKIALLHYKVMNYSLSRDIIIQYFVIWRK